MSARSMELEGLRCVNDETVGQKQRERERESDMGCSC